MKTMRQAVASDRIATRLLCNGGNADSFSVVGNTDTSSANGFLTFYRSDWRKSKFRGQIKKIVDKVNYFLSVISLIR